MRALRGTQLVIKTIAIEFGTREICICIAPIKQKKVLVELHKKKEKVEAKRCNVMMSDGGELKNTILSRHQVTTAQSTSGHR